MIRSALLGKTIIVMVVLASCLRSLSGQEPSSPLSRLKLPGDLSPNFGLPEVSKTFGSLPRFQEDLVKTATREKSRIFTEDTFEKAAPAICIVQKPGGFGTGFFIHSDGWLLTNDHVVNSAFPDPKTGALMVFIHIGGLNKDGDMKLTHQKLPALVYKTSPEKDLALVKLLKKPATKLSLLALAEKAPRVGTECTAIGHPSIGVLWTARDGRVSGVGSFPDERIDFFLQKLWAGGAVSGSQIKDKVNKLPTRKILVSNVSVAPGDSGGPLINDKGEVIGVTFGYPIAQGEKFSSFGYHVHVQEVKDFVGDLTKQPAVPGPYLPSMFPPDPYYALLDLDKDGKPETVAIGPRQGAAPVGILVDLTQSNPKIPQADLFQAVRRGDWKFQFADYGGPVVRTFYDTENVGQMDLILTAFPPNTGKADAVLRRTKNGWIPEPANGRLLYNPEYFRDERLQQAFKNYLKAIRPAPKKG